MPTVTVNGLQLYYADDDFVDPWKPHQTIFMQHYVLGNHAEFRGWVPTLAREYRVLRMDRRGYGDSEKPPFGYEYNVDDLLSDFVGFLDRLGIDRVHYVGQSLGGILGAFFAAAHPERVRSLVLVATPCYIRPVVGEGLSFPGYPDPSTAVMALGSWVYNLGRNVRGRNPAATTEDALKSLYLAEQAARIPAHLIASVLRMVTAPDFNLIERGVLQAIKAPTLLLSPGASQPAPLDEQALMQKLISNCEQVVFEGAGHGITWDIPEECARASLDFIRRHSD